MGPPFRKAGWNIRPHYEDPIAAFAHRRQSRIETRGVQREHHRERKGSEIDAAFLLSIILPLIHLLTVKGRMSAKKLMVFWASILCR